MKKFLMMLCTAGLLVGLLITGGCGSDGFFIPASSQPINVFPPTPTSTPPNYSDASGGIFIYHLQPSSTPYTFTIANFGKGDKIIFPAGYVPSVASVSAANGTITLTAVTADGSGNGKITVLLTKLEELLKTAVITNVASLNSTDVFGPGTVTSASYDVPVMTNGNGDVSAGNYAFTFHPSTTDYTYSIAYLGAGDKLLFTAIPKVDTGDSTGGTVTLSAVTANGGKSVVILTHLTPEQVNQILSLGVNELNVLFGAGTVSTTATTIFVKANGSVDGSIANFTFNFQDSTAGYTYSIAHLGTGDKLVFPAVPKIDSTDSEGGTVTLSAITVSGGKSTVILTHLSAAQVTQIKKVNDLNSVGLFGPGTVSAPTDNFVNSTGSVDGSLANLNFFLQSSKTDYTYSIANFASGNKIVFPAGGSLLSVDNNTFDDNKVKILCVSGGFGTITAELTNLPPGVDQKLISVQAINDYFGKGTITQQ